MPTGTSMVVSTSPATMSCGNQATWHSRKVWSPGSQRIQPVWSATRWGGAMCPGSGRGEAETELLMESRQPGGWNVQRYHRPRPTAGVRPSAVSQPVVASGRSVPCAVTGAWPHERLVPAKSGHPAETCERRLDAHSGLPQGTEGAALLDPEPSVPVHRPESAHVAMRSRLDSLAMVQTVERADVARLIGAHWLHTVAVEESPRR